MSTTSKDAMEESNQVVSKQDRRSLRVRAMERAKAKALKEAAEAKAQAKAQAQLTHKGGERKKKKKKVGISQRSRGTQTKATNTYTSTNSSSYSSRSTDRTNSKNQVASRILEFDQDLSNGIVTKDDINVSADEDSDADADVDVDVTHEDRNTFQSRFQHCLESIRDKQPSGESLWELLRTAECNRDLTLSEVLSSPRIRERAFHRFQRILTSCGLYVGDTRLFYQQCCVAILLDQDQDQDPTDEYHPARVWLAKVLSVVVPVDVSEVRDDETRQAAMAFFRRRLFGSSSIDTDNNTNSNNYNEAKTLAEKVNNFYNQCCRQMGVDLDVPNDNDNDNNQSNNESSNHDHHDNDSDDDHTLSFSSSCVTEKAKTNRTKQSKGKQCQSIPITPTTTTTTTTTMTQSQLESDSESDNERNESYSSSSSCASSSSTTTTPTRTTTTTMTPSRQGTKRKVTDMDNKSTSTSTSTSTSSPALPKQYHITDTWPHLSEFDIGDEYLDDNNPAKCPNFTHLPHIQATMTCVNIRGQIAHGVRPAIRRHPTLSTETVKDLLEPYGRITHLTRLDQIKYELLTRGPVVSASFVLTEPFWESSEGKFMRNETYIDQPHAVLLVGWKFTATGEVWLVHDFNARHLTMETTVAIGTFQFRLEQDVMAPACVSHLPWGGGTGMAGTHTSPTTTTQSLPFYFHYCHPDNIHVNVNDTKEEEEESTNGDTHAPNVHPTALSSTSLLPSSLPPRFFHPAQQEVKLPLSTDQLETLVGGAFPHGILHAVHEQTKVEICNAHCPAQSRTCCLRDVQYHPTDQRWHVTLGCL